MCASVPAQRRDDAVEVVEVGFGGGEAAGAAAVRAGLRARQVPVAALARDGGAVLSPRHAAALRRERLR